MPGSGVVGWLRRHCAGRAGMRVVAAPGVEQLAHRVRAATATIGQRQLRAQLAHRGGARVDRTAHLAVVNSIADADVHG